MKDTTSDSSKQLLPKFDKGVSLLCWAYNEEEAVGDFLGRAVNLLESVADDYEIVLIDDGSIDSTYDIAKNFQLRNPKLKIFKNEKNLNVGFSYQRAIQMATKEYQFVQTIDWSYDITNLRDFLEYLKDYDVVSGARRKPVKVRSIFFKPFIALLKIFGLKHLTKRSDTVWKAIISVINYILIRVLFQVPLSDFQNIVFYPTKWAQSIKYESNSAFTNPEGLIKTYWHGLSIKEVSINFIPRTVGYAKGTKITSVANAFKDVFRLWFRWVLLGRREHGEGQICRLETM